MFPQQNIPESKKDEKWGMQCVRSIVEMAYSNPYSKDKDKMCYNLFNGIIDEKFDYLTKMGDMSYPARLRFIPLVRPRVERLQMEEATKPFVFRVLTVDNNSMSQKRDDAIQRIISMSKMMMNEKVAAAQAMMGQIQHAQQKQGPDGQPMQAPMDPRMQAQMGAMNDQIEITKDDIAKVSAALKVRPQDIKEIVMQKGLRRYIHEKGLDDLFNTAFLDLCITDKEYYMIDYPGNGRDPVVKLIRVDDFWHSADGGTDYVDECEMVCYRERLSASRILDEFGEEMKAKNDGSYEQIERLRSSWTLDRDIVPNERLFLNPEMDSCNTGSGLYAGSELVTNTISVWRTEWRSIRQVKIKESPNQHNENLPFNHIVKEQDEVKLREGEKIEKRYITDIWRGNMIEDNFFCGIKKRPWQLRNPNEPSKTYLSYTGPSFGRRQRRPNSIVWVTKDIQILYCLLYYHHELWLALAGVKGIVMDKSQKPATMSDKEWQYARKTGTMWIQTVSGGKQVSQFNQFQNYDDSLPPTISYLKDMMNQLEEIVSSITGVNRQRMGQSSEYDLKSVTSESIYQSTLVTGMMFYRHDRIRKRVLTLLSNTCAIAWNEGKAIINSEYPDEIIDIPPGFLKDIWYDIINEDSMKQDKMMNDMRVLAGQDHQKGLLSLADVAKLYNIDSIKELEITLAKVQAVAEEKMSNNQQNQAANEQKLKEIDNEVKMQEMQQRGMLEKMRLELDKARLDFEMGSNDAELQQQDKELQVEDATKRFDIASNRATELDYLQQQAIESEAELAIEQEKVEVAREKNKAGGGSSGTGKVNVKRGAGGKQQVSGNKGKK